MRLRLLVPCFLAAVASGGLAHAQVVARAAPGPGQPALSVSFDAQGALLANSCRAQPCDPSGGVVIDVPEPARSQRGGARLSVVRIAPARRLVVVEIPDPREPRSWHAVIAAPIDGSGKPKLIFSGSSGLTEGVWGERQGNMVQISAPRPDGTRSVIIGTQREDLSLCGRPSILAPTLVSPQDLSLKPAKVQRLSPQERDAATVVTAQPATGDSTTVPMLRAIGASSAVGSPGALVDGDPETTWSENRGGDGRGEFVVLRTSDQLPIVGFELVVRPAQASVEHGVAPKVLWLATDKQLFRVGFEQDAWKAPGARYSVELPSAVRTSCVSLITESAYGGGRSARVTLAELSARTEFDPSQIDALVGALAGGGERAEAASVALSALGGEAFAKVAARFESMDEGGRRVALDVIDHAPCAVSAPIYVDALLGPFRAQRIHAEQRLTRCPKEGGQALAAALKTAPPARRGVIVDQLAVLDPALAIRHSLPLVPRSRRAVRQALRIALGRASERPEAAEEVRRALENPRLHSAATIDLLRALGPRVARHQPAAGRAIARLWGPKASFRTRYLLLGPAAELAHVDAAAQALVARAMTSDPSPYVRLHAAQVVEQPQRYRAALERALADSAVRVREAAVEAVAKPQGAFAQRALLLRLAEDKWPLVRAAAAEALAQQAASRDVDRALAQAVNDETPHVRASVVAALGTRRASAHAELVRERLDDEEEHPEVRGAAAMSLGLMCDRSAVALLTEHAEKLADPMLPVERRAVSIMALGALSRIKPPDLAERLAPLLQRGAPIATQGAARAALSSRGTCGRRAGR